jgi:hypothetical protein
MDANGTNFKKLTNDHGYNTSPCWPPDSAKIAFTSQRDGKFNIYVMDADGSTKKELRITPVIILNRTGLQKVIRSPIAQTLMGPTKYMLS